MRLNERDDVKREYETLIDPAKYEKLIDRAITNFRHRYDAHFDVRRFPVAEGLPDREKSGIVVMRAGLVHVVIRSTEGEALAFYRIHKNGRLKYISASKIIRFESALLRDRVFDKNGRLKPEYNPYPAKKD